MGSMRAYEMIQAAGFGAALADHLQHNHFPPVSTDWIPACESAIDAALDGSPDDEVDTPARGVMRADRIVRGLHLEPFVEARMGAREGEEA